MGSISDAMWRHLFRFCHDFIILYPFRSRWTNTRATSNHSQRGPLDTLSDVTVITIPFCHHVIILYVFHRRLMLKSTIKSASSPVTSWAFTTTTLTLLVWYPMSRPVEPAPPGSVPTTSVHWWTRRLEEMTYRLAKPCQRAPCRLNACQLSRPSCLMAPKMMTVGRRTRKNMEEEEEEEGSQEILMFSLMGQLGMSPVASFTEEVNPSLAKPPLKFNEGLTHGGIMTPCGDTDLGQYWLR